MIICKKINGQKIYINGEWIEFIEETPDTIVSATTEKKILILDSVEDMIREMIEFTKRIFERPNIKLSEHKDLQRRRIEV